MNQDIFVIIEHLRGEISDISYIMLAAARSLAQSHGGRVIGVLLGHDVQGLTKNLAADQVMYLDDPLLADFSSDAYQKVLARLITEQTPRAVFFGNTSIGADVASFLSAHLDLPLSHACHNVTKDGNLTSQICGGKIMTESDLSETTTLITMTPGGYKTEEGQSENPPEVVSITTPALDNLRVSLKEYIDPEMGDVDISKEKILISIGRGIQNQDNIELAEELANALDGIVCASRPVVDQGWLPTSRLVGKSGKKVKPEIYLALGISGAPEHVEGIVDSNLIIAINTDPTAPIFDVAQYGAEIDLFDLIEVLTEKVEQAKG
jgi:electron transfer flavoprotein alpha subunit